MAGETPPKALHDYFTLQRGTTYMSRLLEKPGPVLLGLASIQRNGGFRSDSLSSPLKKASLTGFHATAKHIAAKAVSPSSETMRTI